MGLCQSCCRKKGIDSSSQTSPIIPTPIPSPSPTITIEPKWTPFTEQAFNQIDQTRFLVGFKEKTCTTLEEALHEFHDEIEMLNEQIERAKNECYPRREHLDSNGDDHTSETMLNTSSKSKEKKTDLLTNDQSAAIYLFTMRDKLKNSVFFHLHEALKSNEMSKIRKWFKYLNLLKSALNRLPTSRIKKYQTVMAKKEVYRLKSEMITLYSCLSSASTTMDLPNRQFVRENPKEKMMPVIFENIDGYDISKYSANNYEEHLIWPGIRMFIHKSETSRDKIVIHLIPAVDHFSCPTVVCPNRCSRQHNEDTRCDACNYLSFNYKHLCKPVPRCFHGGSEQLKLFECKQCHGKFCKDCSMKGNDPLIFHCHRTQ